MREIEHLIDGSWVASASSFSTHDPATGAVIGHVGVAGAAEVDAAVVAARKAFDDGPWPRLPAAERAAYLTAIADEIERRADELARLESTDTGMPRVLTLGGHLPRAIAHLRYFAAEAVRLSGESFPLDDAYVSICSREPIGVVAVVTPWNAPLAVATMNLGAALAVGNACVLKPSERAPLTCHVLGEIADEIGLPNGVLNVIHGPARPTGVALVAHPAVDALCFVGGTATGREIAATAMSHLKRLTLELGGKSPTIILEGADLPRAIDAALLSVFSSNGEVCTAGSRILVHRDLYEAVVESMSRRADRIRIGDPQDLATEIGPLIDDRHFSDVQSIVDRASRSGGRIVAGGGRPAGLPSGRYFSPTIIRDVTNDMEIARREIFGPVAVVIPVSDADEAVAVANDTEYGLSASVWTRDTSEGLAIARRLRAGVVAVNSPIIRDIRAPFGGFKLSGLGRIGGRWSIEQFTETKTVCLCVTGYPLPRLGEERAR